MADVMKWTLGLLLLCACALPHDQTRPPTTPYAVLGATEDVALLLARRSPWQRAAAVVGTAFVLRYSDCCRRPEAVGLMLPIGAFVPEWLHLAITGQP